MLYEVHFFIFVIILFILFYFCQERVHAFVLNIKVCVIAIDCKLVNYFTALDFVL